IVLREAPRFSNPAIAHVEKQLVARPSASRLAFQPDRMALIEAPDRRGEVDAAARHVRALVDGNDACRFRDIAILARDLNDYHELIDASFREHAIPYFVDRRRAA